MQPEEFFAHLWEDYIRIAPAANKLHDAVEKRGEKIVNDHVAFRTFDRSPIRLNDLEKHVLSLGYERLAPYEFKEKKLRAYGYIHPEGYPRIFLSELMTGEFSSDLQQIVQSLCTQIDSAHVESIDVMWAGRLWEPVSIEHYELLMKESEYAAWLAAIGLRANHFTISVNHLRTLGSIEELLDFVEAEGYELNKSGGRVKGSKEVLLKQGSTMADAAEMEFAGGERHRIRTCYYEFAERFAQPDGKLYDGFVAASADKIFESTNESGSPR